MEEIDDIDASQDLFDEEEEGNTSKVENCPSTSAAVGEMEFKTPGLTGGNLNNFDYKYRSHTRKRKNLKDKENEIDTKLVAALEKKEKSEEELFGLSVGSKLAKMSPQNQALAKIKIQQILFDIEFPTTNVSVPLQSNAITYSQPMSITHVPYTESIMSQEPNMTATYIPQNRELSFAQL